MSKTRKIIVLVGLIGLICPIGVLAEEYVSPNYKLKNANLGEQPFLTSRDVSPPSVTGSGPEIVELNPNSVTIKWFTDKTANSAIAYGIKSTEYTQEIAKTTEYVTTHEVTVVGLTPKTTYYYIARSTDLYGNSGTSTERSFITPLPTPKISGLSIKDLSSNKATVVFTTDYLTTAVLEYVNITSLEKKTVGETNFTKNHVLALTELADNQKYSYYVVARDDEGNEATSSSQTFSTLRDETPPVIGGTKFEVNPISGQDKARIVVSWKTDELSTSQIAYGEGTSTSGNLVDSPVDSMLAINHVVTLVNLKPQTTYRLKAISTDKAGNIGKSDEFLVLTPRQHRTIFQIILDNLQEIFKPFGKLFGN